LQIINNYLFIYICQINTALVSMRPKNIKKKPFALVYIGCFLHWISFLAACIRKSVCV